MQRGGSDLLMDSHLNFVEVHLCFSPTKLFFFWKKKKKEKEAIGNFSLYLWQPDFLGKFDNQ